MKISLVLNAVLAIALVFLSYKLAVTGDGHGGDSDMSEAVLDAILTRTSVRSYEKKSIEKEKIEKLLRAGMAAPSALNKQPWHFVVVTDRSRLESLSEANPYAAMVAKAPLAIVVCGDMNKTLEGDASAFWIQDCSAASENILLAAAGMGLGAVGGAPGSSCGSAPGRPVCEAARRG